MKLDDNVEIRCPKCDWKPDGQPHWMCSCKHQWNTFETAGRCPSCSKVWNETQCPNFGNAGGCGQWSAHLDWYKGLDEVTRRLIEESWQLQPTDS